MSVFRIHNITLFVSLLISISLFSQEDREVVKDTIKTENVTVIKTFNPTINDAFKIETQINDDIGERKNKEVSDFRIQSVPVASTFIPKKAKSKKVKKERKQLPPQNYASLAAGNFGNVEAEAFVSYAVNRDATFSALLLHQSSQGGINEVRVDDFYYDTGLQLTYTKQDRKTPWEIYFEAQHQLYNWYGIPSDFVLSNQQLSAIDPSHNYIDLNVGGTVHFDSDVFKNIQSQLRYFFDDQESNEVNFTANTDIDFKISDFDVKLPVVLDVLSGSFNQEEFLLETDYQIINFGVKPSIDLTYNDIDFKLGASAFLSSDTENSKTDFFVYPNILATYQLKDYGVSLYGGLSGELKQNTYHSASELNPFVTPFLAISPTSQQFNFYIGAQGTLTSQLGYELKASFISENDKPLFQNSQSISNATEQANFGFNNSFNYVYADVKTGNVEGSLKYSYNNALELSLTANFFTYNTSGTDEAWNLPQISTTLSGNYKFNDKLSFDTNIFFVGARKDFDAFKNTVANVDAIFDVNLGANYNITKNWNAFLNGKNITNQNYERWLNFPVQSAQGLVGVRYLFK